MIISIYCPVVSWFKHLSHQSDSNLPWVYQSHLEHEAVNTISTIMIFMYFHLHSFNIDGNNFTRTGDNFNQYILTHMLCTPELLPLIADL